MTENKSKRKKNVEEEYTILKPIEHILKRPDTYVGSLEKQTESQWIMNDDETLMIEKNLSYAPALYKIYDEILVNAADNFQRDKKMDYLDIQINEERGFIKVHNNGKGIPVVIHKAQNMYVPEMIFGHLLTGSNYDDNQKRYGGGRNGYGAKLANIFSTKFTVQCGDSQNKQHFFMVWSNNMQSKQMPKITSYNKKSFVQIVFYPDFKRFGMQNLQPDIVALFKKRAYDMAGVLPKVKVVLNGKQIKVRSFSDYVDLYLGKPSEEHHPIKITVGKENEDKTWEVILSRSDGEFKQVSFVNSICTYKGGAHVTSVMDQLIPKLSQKLKNNTIKTHQIKSKLFVFVNCLIINPVFDSQLKQNLTTRPNKFGSSWQIHEKMIKAIINTGILEELTKQAEARQNTKMAKITAGGKKARIIDVPKLQDANDAGTRKSQTCVLILTEGDSAKSLAVAGLSVVGRDRFGVFPLRGKLLNVRQKDKKHVLENAEISNIVKIMGLQYGKQYTDIKSLRYGSIMIMTDQDADGSHIKGLIINFINYFWPSLFKCQGFLRQFITPLLKATKGNQVHSFFSAQQFKTWSSTIPNIKSWKIKYYKGLGTSTNKEGQEYFKNINNHQKLFRYETQDDSLKIDLAFSKKKIEQRKQWLSHYDPDSILELTPAVKNISYTDFIDKQLIHFSNSNNRRAIPSIMDGFKPGQRKILFACFKRNLKQEIKVAQLGGYVAEHSAYHHGEMSLTETIILLAQNFVGSNNINLLMPNGQFGSRSQGGADHASARYIFTCLSKITRVIFPEADDHTLKYLEDDGQIVEPEFYAPVIPMILVNGCEGLGTGWATKIPNFNPRQIAEQLKRRILGEPFTQIRPWYKNFQGQIIDSEGGVTTRGLIFQDAQNQNTLHVKELPIGKWTIQFKQALNEYISKQKYVTGFKQHHTQDRVHFQIDFEEGYLKRNQDGNLDHVFNFLKMSTKKATTNMVAFNINNQLVKYNTASAIMEEFYRTRVQIYTKRKQYLVSKLQRDVQILNMKTKFILAVVQNKLEIRNVKKKLICLKLHNQGYIKQSQFIKVQTTKKLPAQKKQKNDAADDSGQQDEQNLNDGEVNTAQYNYLLKMPLWNLTYQKVEAVKKQLNTKQAQLDILNKTSENDMWFSDLQEFLKVLNQVEDQQQAQRLKADLNAKGIKTKGNKKALKKVQKKNNSQSEDGSPIKQKKGKKSDKDDSSTEKKSLSKSKIGSVNKQGGGKGRKRKDSVSTSKSDFESQIKNPKAQSLAEDTPSKQYVTGIKENKIKQKLKDQQKKEGEVKKSQGTLDSLFNKYMTSPKKVVEEQYKQSEEMKKKMKANNQRETRQFASKNSKMSSDSQKQDSSQARPFRKKNKKTFEQDQID